MSARVCISGTPGGKARGAAGGCACRKGKAWERFTAGDARHTTGARMQRGWRQSREEAGHHTSIFRESPPDDGSSIAGTASGDHGLVEQGHMEEWNPEQSKVVRQRPTERSSAWQQHLLEWQRRLEGARGDVSMAMAMGDDDELAEGGGVSKRSEACCAPFWWGGGCGHQYLEHLMTSLQYQSTIDCREALLLSGHHGQ